MKKYLIVLILISTVFAQIKTSEFEAVTRANLNDSSLVNISWDSSGTKVTKKMYFIDFREWAYPRQNEDTTFIDAIKVSGEDKVALSGLDSADQAGDIIVAGTGGVPGYKKAEYITDQAALSSLTEFTIPFTNSYTDPIVLLSNKKSWHGYVKTIYADSVLIGINDWGVGDSVKVDLRVYEQ